MPKYGKPIWKIVLEAAEELDFAVFTPKDIIDKAHVKYPEVPEVSLRTYVIAMAPEHPSSHHYPSTRRNHSCFKYHGSGTYSLDYTLTPVVDKTGEEKGQKGPVVRKDSKAEFQGKYREIIESWTERHSKEIIENRLGYTWLHKSRYECEQSRNRVSRTIIESRIKNNGALDIEALNTVIKWGFGRNYPNQDPDKALEITGKAFEYLDQGNLVEATITLCREDGVGISRASKIIGLSDQENLCIYDSRVGVALQNLTYEGERVIKIPPGYGRLSDAGTSNKEFAQNYLWLIWVCEVIRDYMNKHGCTYRLADVEMALFMMGK